MKRKKDYSISPSDSTSNGEPLRDIDRLKIHFTDGYGRLIQSFDFNEFARRPSLAEGFMEAFSESQTANKPATRKSVFRALRRWYRFLDEASVRVSNIEDISTEVVKGYVEWIDRHDWTHKTKHTTYHGVKPLLISLRRKHHLNFDLVKNAFPGVDKHTKPPRKLDAEELSSVLRAAHAEIELTWQDFQKGQSLLSAYVPSEANAEGDLRELPALLWFIKTKFDGVLPSTQVLARQNRRYVTEAVIRHGGTRKIIRYLHATNESLMAYKIVIAAETFGNASAIHYFKRDCSSAHPLSGHRTIVSWEKGRSNRIQRRSFDHRKEKSIPKLIDQVRLLTEPLVPHAHPADRQYLFLSRTRSTAGSLHVGLSSYSNNLLLLRDFCRRHNLRDRNGELLILNLAILRPTGLTLAYRNLGGDILAVQRLANHVSSRTTATYVEDPEVEKDNDVHIAKLQAKWVDTVSRGGAGADELEQELEVDEANAEAIIAGQNATASGFVCKDPYAGVGPGQRKGELCIAWLGCFVCPNAVIPMEPEYLARIIQVRDHLLAGQYSLHPDRWRLLYEPIVRIIERDILPRFTNPWVIEEAKERAGTLPPLPALT